MDKKQKETLVLALLEKGETDRLQGRQESLRIQSGMVKSRVGVIKSLACITDAYLHCNGKDCGCKCHY